MDDGPEQRCAKAQAEQNLGPYSLCQKREPASASAAQRGVARVADYEEGVATSREAGDRLRDMLLAMVEGRELNASVPAAPQHQPANGGGTDRLRGSLLL